jgi:hypothetical protein
LMPLRCAHQVPERAQHATFSKTLSLKRNIEQPTPQPITRVTDMTTTDWLP